MVETTGDSMLIVRGRYFGVVNDPSANPNVFYGPYEARFCLVRNDAEIECSTVEGTGRFHTVRVVPFRAARRG